MLHRQVFVERLCVEGPEITHLGAVGVDDGQPLTGAEPHRHAAARGHGVTPTRLGRAIGGNRAGQAGILAVGCGGVETHLVVLPFPGILAQTGGSGKARTGKGQGLGAI